MNKQHVWAICKLGFTGQRRLSLAVVLNDHDRLCWLVDQMAAVHARGE